MLVVDDEELARLRLKSLVGECGEPSAVVVGEAANAAQALVWLATRSCDLLLLDVQMPGRDGTQLAAELRLRTPAPAIVFVTAHAEHALKAFDLEAVDYLTKPVKRERLQAALRRVAQRLGAPRGGGRRGQARGRGPGHRRQRPRPDHPRAGGRRALHEGRAEVRDAAHGRPHPRPRRLARRARERLGDRFLRVHRNALVARRAVRALERRAIAGENADDGLEGWGVCIAPVNEWLAVSRRQVAAVREALVAAER